MTKLALWYHQIVSLIITPTSTSGSPCYLQVPSEFHRHYRLPLLRRGLAVVSKAKSQEFIILGNPSVTVEKCKYSYDVETLINKLSSLPPRGSIVCCFDTFKNKLSLFDFSHVFKEFAQRIDWQRSLCPSSICSASVGASRTNTSTPSSESSAAKGCWISPPTFSMKWWRIRFPEPCSPTLRLSTRTVETDSTRLLSNCWTG